MESSSQEREVRAARNQAMFRAVNDNLEALNKVFASMTDTFAIACECADTNCIETIDIRSDDYAKVRAEPRHFVVLREHVLPAVEDVIRESDGYVVVEKTETAGEVAERLGAEAARRDSSQSRLVVRTVPWTTSVGSGSNGSSKRANASSSLETLTEPTRTTPSSARTSTRSSDGFAPN